METNNIKIEAILNKDKEKKNADILGYVVNGEYYERERGEDIISFYSRVVKETKEQGIDFNTSYRTSNNIETFTKKEYKKKIKSIATASDELKDKTKRNKKIALLMVAAMALSFVGFNKNVQSFAKEKLNVFANKETEQTKETNQIEINEDNPVLKSIYEEIAKTKDGKQIIKQLQNVDKQQKTENEKLNQDKYKDKNGNILFFKAREVLAKQDISNAENFNMIALDHNETRICDYLNAAEVAIPAMYITGDSNNEYRLIEDEATRKEMKNEEEFAENAMSGKIKASKIDAHFDELMETGLTYSAVGVNVGYLGEADNMTLIDHSRNGKLKKFVKLVTTNNNGLKKLNDYASAKEVNAETQKLIDKALEEMDKQNIKVDLKSRDKFDASTTEAGIKMHGIKLSGGGYLLSQGETYYYYYKDGKTTTEKVSREEAKRKFGSDAVKKAEEKAENNTRVDTDGDGKKDSTIKEANEKEEQKKEELEEKADNYEKDYAQGQSDGLAGKPKAKNTPGYNAGYANGQKQNEAANEPEKIIEEEEIYDKPSVEEPKTETQPVQETKQSEPTNDLESTPQKVMYVEREGEVYETEQETTSKVKSKTANS